MNPFRNDGEPFRIYGVEALGVKAVLLKAFSFRVAEECLGVEDMPLDTTLFSE